MYVCICNAVTDRDIREAVERGIHSFEGLRRELKVATCCGRCEACARNTLAEARARVVARLSPELEGGLALAGC